MFLVMLAGVFMCCACRPKSCGFSAPSPGSEPSQPLCPHATSCPAHPAENKGACWRSACRPVSSSFPLCKMCQKLGPERGQCQP